MERQKKIIDASIIIKWFANENYSDKAIILRDKHINEEISLVVPELVFLETINGLKYKKLEQSILEKANKDLWNIQLEIFYLDEFLINKAISASAEYNLSIYDSIYVALAQIYGTQLITADEKLLKTPNAIALNKF